MSSHSKRPGIEPLRRFPYYKIQIWDENRAVWVDIQKKFYSIEDMHKFVESNLKVEQISRAVVVSGDRNRRVDSSIRLSV